MFHEMFVGGVARRGRHRVGCSTHRGAPILAAAIPHALIRPITHGHHPPATRPPAFDVLEFRPPLPHLTPLPHHHPGWAHEPTEPTERAFHTKERRQWHRGSVLQAQKPSNELSVSHGPGAPRTLRLKLLVGRTHKAACSWARPGKAARRACARAGGGGGVGLLVYQTSKAASAFYWPF